MNMAPQNSGAYRARLPFLLIKKIFLTFHLLWLVYYGWIMKEIQSKSQFCSLPENLMKSIVSLFSLPRSRNEREHSLRYPNMSDLIYHFSLVVHFRFNHFNLCVLIRSSKFLLI